MSIAVIPQLGVAAATVNANTSSSPNTLPMRDAQGNLLNEGNIGCDQLASAGGIQAGVAFKTASFTMSVAEARDYVCDATAGNIVASPPLASANVGVEFFITISTSSANTVAISGAVGASGDITFNTQYARKRVFSDGTNWRTAPG